MRTVVCVLAISAAAPGAFGRSQDLDRQPAPAPAEHLEELDRCREGLLDPEARPRNRRRWAAQLASYDSREAKELLVELLGLQARPEVQRAVAAEIADRARDPSTKMDDALVAPLIAVLGAENAELRSLAAQALTRFPGTDVPDKLGEVASDVGAALPKRLAAIDALAPNTHRRKVVGQLIALLGSSIPAIDERVIAALDTATNERFGADVEAWRAWWRRKSQLSEEAWLAERARLDRERLRQVTVELERDRDAARLAREEATDRIRTLQRELFRVLTPEQREAKLVDWLNDPMVVVRSTALTLIRARMADEGKRPDGAVLDALLDRLQEGPGELRSELLEILQNLDDPRVVAVVLLRLKRETDAGIRALMFRALGKLEHADAIPALVREIASPQSPTECVREAAIALGLVADQTAPGAPGADHAEAAVEALRGRYQTVSPEDIPLRAALLSAMAGLGDAAFTDAFLTALETDQPVILRPAIRGIEAVGDRSVLPRLRALTAHPDLLVRLAALEAVGALGFEDADLESLLTRLNPAIEMDVLATDAAWRGFLSILGNRSLEQRIAAADRLRDLPQYEAKYLATLAESLTAVNGTVEQLTAVYDRLARVYVAQNRHAEAVSPLRRLYQAQSTHSNPDAFNSGLRLLHALLYSGAETGTAELISQIAAGADEAEKARIIDVLTEYFYAAVAEAHLPRSRDLLTELRTIPRGLLGEGWTDAVEQMAAQLDRVDTPESPSSPPRDDPGPSTP